MSREPSDATRIRNYTAQVNRLCRQVREFRQKVADFEKRAIAAELEAKEWRDRFDTLLKRDGVPR